MEGIAYFERKGLGKWCGSQKRKGNKRKRERRAVVTRDGSRVRTMGGGGGGEKELVGVFFFSLPLVENGRYITDTWVNILTATIR